MVLRLIQTTIGFFFLFWGIYLLLKGNGKTKNKRSNKHN